MILLRQDFKIFFKGDLQILDLLTYRVLERYSISKKKVMFVDEFVD